LKILVIGPGRVGSALGRALEAAGETVLGRFGPGPLPPELAKADAVLVAVPDAAVPEVGESLARSGLLRPDAAVLHTAGALGPDALGVTLASAAHPGAFHPLQTFPSLDSSPPLAGVPFALGGDARALEVGRALAQRLGGVPLVIPDAARALYHAAAVLACGHVAALAGAAARALARAAGISEDEALYLLGPILQETAWNLGVLGLPAAMTGPVSRGDRAVAERHAEVLGQLGPEVREIYKILASIGGRGPAR
jgi:predicted short-subunit dehydrogenase-like oxidoreductase (DUF2520 family)